MGQKPKTIRYRTVVRLLGLRLADLERERARRIADLEAEKKRLFREMRSARIQLKSMRRAVRRLLGMENRGCAKDPLADLYLDALENEEGDW